MKACFDKNGFLLWVLEGDIEVSVGSDHTLLDVPDRCDPNELFVANGQLVPREIHEIQLERKMLTGSDDKIILSGLPDPAWLSVDGKVRKVTGGSLTISHAMRFELVGPHRSNPVNVTYQTWAQAAETVRVERDARLDASDWTQMPDARVNREAWAAYRQELRDLPAKQPKVTIDTVVWPQPPKTS